MHKLGTLTLGLWTLLSWHWELANRLFLLHSVWKHSSIHPGLCTMDNATHLRSPTLKVALLSSVEPSWKYPHRYTQRSVAIVILNPLTLATKVSYHTMHCSHHGCSVIQQSPWTFLPASWHALWPTALHSSPTLASRNRCSTLDSLNPTSWNSTRTQGPTVSISLAWLIPSLLEPSRRICDVTKDRISFVSKAESYPTLHYFPCLSICWQEIDSELTCQAAVQDWEATGMWLRHLITYVCGIPSFLLALTVTNNLFLELLSQGRTHMGLGLCNIYREEVWLWNISWLFQGSLTVQLVGPSWWLVGWRHCRNAAGCLVDSVLSHFAVAAVPGSGRISGAHRASAPLSN